MLNQMVNFKKNIDFQKNVLLEFKQVKKKIQFFCWNCDLLIEFKQIIEIEFKIYAFFSRKNIIFDTNRLY